MEIAITEAQLEEKPILRHLLELYMYDHSEFDGRDAGPTGLFGYKYLDHYWTEEGRHAFLVRLDRHPAGFALVNGHAYVATEPGALTMAELFVMRKYRKLGIGRQIAAHVFDRFRGWWEVRQTLGNLQGHVFWRKVIDEYTGGDFRELDLHDERWHGTVQIFNNAGSTGGSDR